ncbi:MULTISPECIES: hypothetical protein [Amycolatopsis]|uniref:Transposase n=1 Tax=Amycolatopsis bullii TaxID=941987 RepID=A0ABQ3KS82_9PSEU|nr:hypothetical protein [Amycolatopsis bullii]GHG50850.1 hypothetical protein GCM10017567_87100 [Amycolatopsis bullii]
MPDRITRAADGFAELVLADSAWVRAEFDAIVAANFGPPPPPVPAARRRGRPRPPAAVGVPRRRPGARLLAAKCPRRERAPPRPRTVKRTNTDERGVMP